MRRANSLLEQRGNVLTKEKARAYRYNVIDLQALRGIGCMIVL